MICFCVHTSATMKRNMVCWYDVVWYDSLSQLIFHHLLLLTLFSPYFISLVLIIIIHELGGQSVNMLVSLQQRRVTSSTRRISWQDSKVSLWLSILPHTEVRGREEDGREGGRKEGSPLVSVKILYMMLKCCCMMWYVMYNIEGQRFLQMSPFSFSPPLSLLKMYLEVFAPHFHPSHTHPSCDFIILIHTHRIW